MKKQTMKKLGTVGIVTLVLLAGGIFCWSQGASADWTGGNTNAEQTGGCGPNGLSCTSAGVVNRVTGYDDFMGMKNEIGLSNNQKNDIAEKAAGMNNPVVFQFTYGAFDPSTGKYLGYERGQLTAEVANRNNTVYMDPSTVQGGISFAQYQFFYNLAVAHGVYMDYDFAQTGAFVFDLDWLPEGVTLDVLKDLQDMKEVIKKSKTESSAGTKRATFQSKTIIDVGNAIPEGPQDSGWDGYVSLEFSSDEPVTVSFTHTMQYSGFSLSGSDVMTSEGSAGTDAMDMNTTDEDDTTNNFTPYSITTGGGGNFGVFGTDAATSDFSGGSQTVSLSPGETMTVCSNISYQQKVATMTSLKHIQRKKKESSSSESEGEDSGDDEGDEDSEDEDGGDDWETVGTDHFDWYNAGYSGSGGSGACATIHRPADPTGEPQNPNANNGSTTSDLMFAGETAELRWSLQAPTHDTRRLMERQITAHLVNSVPGRDGRFFNGTSRSSSDPYNYYSGSYIVERKNFGDEHADLNHSADDYRGDFWALVTDQVGYKYCHSGGYRYESWYAINGAWKHDTRTDKNYRNYWYVYGASCRTIAKKPSVAIWNGGFMTAGGVTTSASTRFDNAGSSQFGVKADAGGAQTLYGSWVEYLASVGRSVTNFGSGASFSIGSKNRTAPRTGSAAPFGNSSLTISNQNRLGGSGISNNSTYRTRLTTFLENQATKPGGNTLNGLNVSDTQILSYDGNLSITGNIVAAAGPYSSIYHIPQAVIFVHGNLDISSNVTRIDAWLIVDGKINTCSDFRSGDTQSDTPDYQRSPCTQQLAFNGPVMANNIVLNRSFGSDPLPTSPYRGGVFGAAPAKQNAGEIFNLSMDTYLWAYAQAGRYASSYTESYSRELAPRY